MNLTALVAAHGGVVRTSQLLGWGVPSHRLRVAIRSGELVRPRRGWVHGPAASPDIVAAVTVGGRLACVSAASTYGLWTPVSAQLHVAFPSHAGHGSSGGVVPHWDSARWMDAAAPVESLLAVITHVIECLPHEQAVAVVDSALHRGAVSIAAIASLAPGAREKVMSVLNDADPASESGYETYVRLRFARNGYRIRTQVQIPWIGRVDLIIGDRLVIEVDSRKWHESEDAFLNDRSRDLALLRAGYLVVRITTHHIDHEWAWVAQVVASLVSSGEHTWGARHTGDSATHN